MLTWKKKEVSLCGLGKKAGREGARTVGSSPGVAFCVAPLSGTGM